MRGHGQEKGAGTLEHLVELAAGEAHQPQGLGLHLGLAGGALLQVLVELQREGGGGREQDEQVDSADQAHIVPSGDRAVPPPA